MKGFLCVLLDTAGSGFNGGGSAVYEAKDKLEAAKKFLASTMHWEEPIFADAISFEDLSVEIEALDFKFYVFDLSQV